MKTSRDKFLDDLLKGGSLDLAAVLRQRKLKKPNVKALPPDVSFIIQAAYDKGQLHAFCQATPTQAANSITSYLMIVLSEDQKTMYCGAVAGVIDGNVPPGKPLAVTAYTNLFDPAKDGRTLVVLIHGNIFIPPKTSRTFDAQQTFNI